MEETKARQMRRDATDDRQSSRYRAPALEKGLDILELLAGEITPLSPSLISQRLDRSMSELFRMIQVLEHRGYLEQAENGEGFRLSDRLFMLGMERAPVKTMLEIALPVMREMSASIGQSCHLAVRSGGQMIVVARIESPEQIGFSVRVGYRRSFALTASGTILFAFQSTTEQARWLKTLHSDITPDQIAQLQQRAREAQERGYERSPSGFTMGVTDLSAPLLKGMSAAAALTVPFVHSTPLIMPIDETIEQLGAAAAEISAALALADHRA